MLARRIKRLVVPFALASLLACVAVSCNSDHDNVQLEDAGVDAHRPVRPDSAAFDSSIEQPDADNDVNVTNDGAVPSFNIWPAHPGPIKYWGGPVMLGTPNVYFIWYGNWTGNDAPSILEDLIKGFSQTGYSNALTSFYQVNYPDSGVDSGPEAGVKAFLSGRVAFSRSIYVGYSRGKALIQGDISKIVADLLRTNSLPYDPSAVYFVLTSSDVTESMGVWGTFCGAYCGYHDSMNVDGVTIKFSFVGDPSNCPSNCIPQKDLFVTSGLNKSPNDNWGADAMASVIIHELTEAVTDPEPTTNQAWLDTSLSYENADMCAWRFDPTYPTVNGSRANVRFGGRDYLIQQTWVIDGDGGRCDLQP